MSTIAINGNNPTFLMDILLEIQKENGLISDENIKLIARELNISRVDVEQTISFYHFFTTKPTGKYTIYLDNSVVACMMGRDEVAKEFEIATGCKFGSVSVDGLFGLHNTACIGMSDQSPAAIINGVVFTKLNPNKVRELISAFKSGKKVEELSKPYGDGKNSSELIKSMVNNNIQKKGEVIFSDYEVGTALKALVNKTPEDVINEVKESNIRGRGGAGFPTGMKWDFCSKSINDEKYVICNADEGEPGTFKDRVILTENPQRVFEGMAVAGYAIGAKQGLLYLRHEYMYLKTYLETQIEDLRRKNLLGKSILGKNNFDFDIRIQLGAGAYVCGEESALIESAEGKRGEPRNRPPFPAQKGYLQKPTTVNNVETLASIVRIIEKGANWYKSIGTKDSTGTKVLSISGDCKNPGIYEIEWGMTIKEMLEICGAEEETQAVQVAGPSGRCIGPNEFGRKIANEDLPTGGSMTVIGKDRNLLKDVVKKYMEFFIDESCGSCIPCRSLNPIILSKLNKIIEGTAVTRDIEDVEKFGKMMKDLNRCGLGQTAANPILTTIENFKSKYTELVKNQKDNNIFFFDLEKAVKESCEYVNRKPNIHHN